MAAQAEWYDMFVTQRVASAAIDTSGNRSVDFFRMIGQMEHAFTMPPTLLCANRFMNHVRRDGVRNRSFFTRAADFRRPESSENSVVEFGDELFGLTLARFACYAYAMDNVHHGPHSLGSSRGAARPSGDRVSCKIIF